MIIGGGRRGGKGGEKRGGRGGERAGKEEERREERRVDGRGRVEDRLGKDKRREKLLSGSMRAKEDKQC